MEIKYVDDYVDKVWEKFPSLTRKEIEYILKFGLRSFYTHNVYGGDVLLKSPYFTLYCGKFFRDNLIFYHYWRIKNKIKLRIKYKRAKKTFNGEYYFGLTDKEFENYKAQFKSRGRRRQRVKFDYIYAYKILEECMLDRGRKHFFVLYFPTDVGWTLYQKNYETRNIKYIYRRTKDGFEQI